MARNIGDATNEIVNILLDHLPRCGERLLVLLIVQPILKTNDDNVYAIIIRSY